MSYHRNQILQAIASLEKVGASIFFPRSLSHAHSSVPLLEKPSSSPSCIPVCFLSFRPPNSVLIAPFRLLSCASTRAPRSWAGGWPQFPRGFLPRPRLGESADSKTLSRGAEGRAWLGAAGREMRGGAAGAEREGHGGEAAGAGHASPHSRRKEDPVWPPREAQAMENLQAPDSPRLFTVPRKTSACSHTLKTQQPGFHQTTRKNKVRTASVIMVRLPEEFQQGRQETGLKKGGRGRTFRPGHRLVLERESSEAGMSAGSHSGLLEPGLPYPACSGTRS